MKVETKRKIASVFFPERCPYCSELVLPCEIACDECIQDMPKEIFHKQIGGIFSVASALPYKDQYKDAILRLKFGKRKQFSYQLAKYMYLKFFGEVIFEDYDLISSVPLHKDNLKERGFNQSELLARDLSRFINVSYTELLNKSRKNKPQHSLTGDKREKNVKGVYRCIDKSLVEGKRILLVDDIITTGFTLTECASILEKAGAKEIMCLTFAITLPKTT